MNRPFAAGGKAYLHTMEDVRTPQLGAVDARPMSPHLGVWRWHVTMLASILTRATGLSLYAGALIAAGWAVALALGPDAYADFLGVAGSWFGKLVMLGLTVSFFYHLAAGLRHLWYDSGRGFALRSSNQSAAACIVFTVLATAAVWAIAFATGAA